MGLRHALEDLRRQADPDDSVGQGEDIESSAQKALTNLVVGRCSSPAVKVLMKNPKNGLQETMTLLAGKLVNAEIERRASPILSLTMTDLMGLRK